MRQQRLIVYQYKPHQWQAVNMDDKTSDMVLDWYAMWHLLKEIVHLEDILLNPCDNFSAKLYRALFVFHHICSGNFIPNQLSGLWHTSAYTYRILNYLQQYSVLACDKIAPVLMSRGIYPARENSDPTISIPHNLQISLNVCHNEMFVTDSFWTICSDEFNRNSSKRVMQLCVCIV